MITHERLLNILRSVSQSWLSSVSGSSHVKTEFRRDRDSLRKVTHDVEAAEISAVNEISSLLAILKAFIPQWKDEQPIPLSVMDFGCGTGRLLDAMPRSLSFRYTGCDIDKESILYCKSHYPEWSNGYLRRFDVISEKILPYVDCRFDVSFAFSVFTHMTAEDEVIWLNEMARVTELISVVSVHGLVFLSQCETWKNNEDGLTEVLNNGRHCVDGINQAVTEAIGQEIYKDVAHTPDYIISEWNKYVDVLAVIPGGFGGVHDAVVFRRKR